MTRTSPALASVVFFMLCGLSFSLFMPNKADIDPNDKLIFIKETIKMQCRLRPTATEFEASGMYMTIYLNNNETMRVPDENVTIIDNRTIHAVFEITELFRSITPVTCKHGSTNLRSISIYIERPLLNVNDFSGIYFYDNSTVLTTWSLGQTYLLNSIGVAVDWNPFAPPNNGNPCDVTTLESCTISKTYAQESIFFRVNVSILYYARPNSTFLNPIYSTSVISIFKFVRLDNMKTGPAENLTVVDKNTTCVNLTWKMSKYFTECYLCDSFYKLDMKTKDDDDFKIAVDNALRPRSQENMQVCVFKPDTTYVLRLQIKAFETNPWSDPISIEFRSDEDRPLTGPPVTDTSYSAEECVGQKRNVIIYWNDLPESSLRGQITKFEVKIDNVSNLVRPSSNYFEGTVRCNSTQEVQIYSATKKGLSLSPTVIIIPKESEELVLENDLMFRVEETGDEVSSLNVSVTWDVGEQAENLTLIMYMCQETYKPFTCFNDFRTIEANANDGKLLLSNLPDMTSAFGYALKNDKGQKQGIHWTNCVYRADLPPPAIDLHVSPDSHSDSLLISWTSTQCNRATKVLILRYHLTICSKQKVADCKKVEVNSSSTNIYIAKNLQGGKTYSVSIQAESPAGKGPPSMKTGIPQSSNDNTASIASIIIGVTAFALAVGLLIACTVRRCKHGKRHVESMVRENKSLVLDNIQKDFTKDESLLPDGRSESGIGTGTHRSSSNEGNAEPLKSRNPESPPQLPSRNADSQLPVPLRNEECPTQSMQINYDTDDSIVNEYMHLGNTDLKPTAKHSLQMQSSSGRCNTPNHPLCTGEPQHSISVTQQSGHLKGILHCVNNVQNCGDELEECNPLTNRNGFTVLPSIMQPQPQKFVTRANFVLTPSDTLPPAHCSCNEMNPSCPALHSSGRESQAATKLSDKAAQVYDNRQQLASQPTKNDSKQCISPENQTGCKNSGLHSEVNERTHPVPVDSQAVHFHKVSSQIEMLAFVREIESQSLLPTSSESLDFDDSGDGKDYVKINIDDKNEEKVEQYRTGSFESDGLNMEDINERASEPDSDSLSQDTRSDGKDYVKINIDDKNEEKVEQYSTESFESDGLNMEDINERASEHDYDSLSQDTRQTELNCSVDISDQNENEFNSQESREPDGTLEMKSSNTECQKNMTHFVPKESLQNEMCGFFEQLREAGKLNDDASNPSHASLEHGNEISKEDCDVKCNAKEECQETSQKREPGYVDHAFLDLSNLEECASSSVEVLSPFDSNKCIDAHLDEKNSDDSRENCHQVSQTDDSSDDDGYKPISFLEMDSNSSSSSSEKIDLF